MDLDVINESVISVNVCIKMPEDGPDVPSITLQDYAVMDWPKPETPTWPKEFTVEPSKINIPPESKVTLKVITKHIVIHYFSKLMVANTESKYFKHLA